MQATENSKVGSLIGLPTMADVQARSSILKYRAGILVRQNDGGGPIVC